MFCVQRTNPLYPISFVWHATTYAASTVAHVVAVPFQKGIQAVANEAQKIKLYTQIQRQQQALKVHTKALLELRKLQLLLKKTNPKNLDILQIFRIQKILKDLFPQHGEEIQPLQKLLQALDHETEPTEDESSNDAALEKAVKKEKQKEKQNSLKRTLRRTKNPDKVQLLSQCARSISLVSQKTYHIACALKILIDPKTPCTAKQTEPIEDTICLNFPKKRFHCALLTELCQQRASKTPCNVEQVTAALQKVIERSPKEDLAPFLVQEKTALSPFFQQTGSKALKQAILYEAIELKKLKEISELEQSFSKKSPEELQELLSSLEKAISQMTEGTFKSKTLTCLSHLRTLSIQILPQWIQDHPTFFANLLGVMLLFTLTSLGCSMPISLLWSVFARATISSYLPENKNESLAFLTLTNLMKAGTSACRETIEQALKVLGISAENPQETFSSIQNFFKISLDIVSAMLNPITYLKTNHQSFLNALSEKRYAEPLVRVLAILAPAAGALVLSSLLIFTTPLGASLLGIELSLMLGFLAFGVFSVVLTKLCETCIKKKTLPKKPLRFSFPTSKQTPQIPQKTLYQLLEEMTPPPTKTATPAHLDLRKPQFFYHFTHRRHSRDFRSTKSLTRFLRLVN